MTIFGRLEGQVLDHGRVVVLELFVEADRMRDGLLRGGHAWLTWLGGHESGRRLLLDLLAIGRLLD